MEARCNVEVLHDPRPQAECWHVVHAPVHNGGVTIVSRFSRVCLAGATVGAVSWASRRHRSFCCRSRSCRGEYFPRNAGGASNAAGLGTE
eukprot:995719-Pyramimonas_sp.AAC.1